MDGLYTYRARVLRVIDGDSLHVVVDLGFHLKMEMRLRLLGVDTPELRPRRGTFDGTKRYETDGQREQIIEAAKKAQAFVREEIENQSVTIRTEKADSFGRFLADVWYKRGDAEINLNQELLDRGLAEVYKR